MPDEFSLPFKTFESQEILEMFDWIDFSVPIELPGIPGSIEMGSFSMDIQSGQSVIQKKYVILNDRLVQDTEFPWIAYPCRERFVEFLYSV